MAWTTPTVRATGDTITAAIYNADIINDLLYLHGDAGAVALINTLQVGGAATGGLTPNLYLVSTSTGAGITFGDTSGVGTRAYIDMDGFTDIMRVSNYRNGSAGALKLNDAGGDVYAGTMRLQRRGDANMGHMESALVNVSGGGSSSASFTTAFTSTPQAVAGASGFNAAGAVYVSAISTTALTVNNPFPGATNVSWIATGVG